LATKLIVPPMPRWLIARPRLLDLLTQGAQGLLTLVSAPPGAGKTMLLGSWVRSGQPPGPLAWVSLDPDDNDRVQFWAYVLAGVRASGVVPADGLLGTLVPPTAGTGDAFLPALVNGLAELPGPMVVVLDDVHELTSPQVLADLEFLVRHAPAQLRLVLATRADPALPLARLRVAGAVTEVRASELAFSREEAAELLAGLGTPLPDADVAALWTRTEGWAAGLRLAALSLQHHPDPAGFVAAFSGDDRAVADYLIGEVLDRQPAGVREFLLRTSITQRLTGGLADALTGGHDGIDRLRELERTNAFVVALDRNRITYRYHQLFAELLRARLYYQYPDEVAELHRRAARWHAADGVAVEAVRHALAVKDWDHAGDLLVERSGSLWATPTILWDLLMQLPRDLVRRSPELALTAAVNRFDDADLEAAQAYRRLAEANATAVPDDRRGWFDALLVMARMQEARFLGELDGLRTASQELLELAPAADKHPEWLFNATDLRAAALSNLGAVAFWNGEFAAATRHLEETLTAVTGRPLLPAVEYPLLNCLSHLALVEVARGRLRRAVERGQEAVALADRRGWAQAPQGFGGHLALAWACYHRGDLTAAGGHLERAALAAHERTAVAAAALVRSWLLASQGQPGAGLAALRNEAVARAGTGWRPPRLLADLLAASQAGLLVAIGDPRAARTMLATADHARPSAEGAVAWARLQRADRDPAAAAATLAAFFQDDLAASAYPFVVLEARLLEAVVRAELGAHDQAAQSLEAALALAAPEGYRQVFLDGGAPVRALLARQLERGTQHPALVVDLVGELGQLAAIARAATTPLVEPLSERERMVLYYLASVLSTGEIAAELYVSPNTVKTHLKSIYRKLGVTRRREAVNRARQLGLL
jgi:LuxR family transcriptional regulator, maltose regulon positive regulatory protein